MFVSILLTSLVLHRLNVWWRTRDASSVASGPDGPGLGQGSVQSSAQNSRTTLHWKFRALHYTNLVETCLVLTI